MFRRTSKHPEIFVRLDVRLNVLEFSNVYTYFLGRLDVNPKKFLIYTGCAEDDDDDDENDGLDCMDYIHNDDGDGDEGFVGGLRKNGQAFPRCGCNKAKQMPASALNQRWFAILDAMEGLRTPNVLTTTRIEI